MDTREQSLIRQKAICKKYSAAFSPIDFSLKVGVSRGFLCSTSVFNGLREPPEEGLTGWFFWGDEEPSTDSDFFLPLHAEHLKNSKPQVLDFLALPPNWRFHINKEFSDAWEQK